MTASIEELDQSPVTREEFEHLQKLIVQNLELTDKKIQQIMDTAAAATVLDDVKARLEAVERLIVKE